MIDSFSHIHHRIILRIINSLCFSTWKCQRQMSETKISAKSKHFGTKVFLLFLLIHALELIYFDSNTQETTKKPMYPSNSSNFPTLHCRNPVKSLTVTQCYSAMAKSWKNLKHTTALSSFLVVRIEIDQLQGVNC